MAKTLAGKVGEVKTRAAVTRKGRLLTTEEFKTAETAVQETEAAKEDVRIANENISVWRRRRQTRRLIRSRVRVDR